MVALIAPAVGIGFWELLQRHRFDGDAQRIQAALEAFQSRAVVLGKDGQPLPTASGRKAVPYVAMIFERYDSWEWRSRWWIVGADFVDENGRWLGFRVEIVLSQYRKVLMKTPEIVIHRRNLQGLALGADFDQAFSGFTGIQWVER